MDASYQSLDLSRGKEIFEKIASNMEKVIYGQGSAIRKLLTGFASCGHVLLEDVPGTGKTTLAKVFAHSIRAEFKRIQFTPDLLPTDILGVNIFDQQKGDFSLHKGPVFTQILLADEINRASPRTQSALLEAMGEQQVSIDNTMHKLFEPFFVLATQNPLAYQGTYPLPEAQMDRFTLRFGLGYVSPEEEVDILSEQSEDTYLDNVDPCVSLQEALLLRQCRSRVRVSRELKRYVVDIADATRNSEKIRLGASTRASLCLVKCAQALAMFDGLDFVIPENVREIAVDVLAHRILVDSPGVSSSEETRALVREIVDAIPVPA